MSLSSEAVTSSCESGEKQRERTGIACPVEEKEHWIVTFYIANDKSYRRTLAIANYRSGPHQLCHLQYRSHETLSGNKAKIVFRYCSNYIFIYKLSHLQVCARVFQTVDQTSWWCHRLLPRLQACHQDSAEKVHHADTMYNSTATLCVV